MKKKQVQALLAGMAAMMAVILPTSSVWAQFRQRNRQFT